MKRHAPIAALLLAIACGPNTDLTVPPPPEPEVGALADVPPPRATGRLVDWLKPVRYTLDLDVDPGAARYTGTVTIEVALDRPTSAFVVHAEGLDVLSAHVLANGEKISATTTSRMSAGSPGSKDELVLQAERRIETGIADLRISFAGALGERLRGIYRVKEGGASYVFTQFEPADARRMFPCFDDPIYKVPFDVSVTVPDGNRVFFNTPEKSRDEVGGKTQYTFATTKRMPTYLLALAIGPLEAVNGSAEPVPIRVIAKPGSAKLAKPALRIAKEHLKILSAYFGSPYPYAKLDLVAVPNFGAGAMENAGLVAFREELLLYDDATASAKTKRDVAMTIAHELAHHWFGNLVTMKWWDDLWLNEGFATFMESVVVDRWRPDMNADLELLSLTGWVMDIDALSTARAVRNPVENTHQALDAFDGITYVKGAAFVRMLEAWLGDASFQLGMKAYLSEHAWGNASADDLFRALERTSTKKVSAVAETFLNAPGVPLVSAELACGGGLPPRVKLSQKPYSGLEGEARSEAPKTDRQWRIPVCIEHGRNKQQQTQRDCTLLEEPSREMALSTEQCPDWVLPNADYAGYYRFAMPADQLETLAVRTRPRAAADNIGFLSNLWALVQSGDVEAPAMLELVLAYKSEKRREVIEEVIKVLEHISDALVEPKARPAFEKYVSALLLPTAKRLGWDARTGDSEDDRLLRRSVLSAMSRLSDDPWMTLQARKRALAFLADPDAAERDTAAIALTHAARQGDLSHDQLKARLDAADEPAERIIIIEAMASLAKRSELQKTLALITSGEIRAQDGVYVARAAAQVPETRAVLIDWLRDHVQEVAEKMPGFGLARMVSVIRHLCDAEAKDSVGKSLGAAIEKLGRSRRRLDVALETASLCIDLRARQADGVTSYLTSKRRF